MHRRRANPTVGVASVDLSGPHIATPMQGQRIGQLSGRYFVVMVIRPDLSTAKRSMSTQTADEDPGAAPEVHGGDGAAGDPSYVGQPLIYVEIVGSKSETGDAVKKMIGQVREEMGRLPVNLPSHWNVHRLHSDKGQELLPKTLDLFCLDNGIRRTTT